MLNRCRNPNNRAFADYGGRGIAVCERWLVFENFLSDMGDKPEGMSIDRIDNDGNYEPSNCRWATVAEQQRNRRNVVLDGVSVSLLRYMRKRGETSVGLAIAFGVNRHHVNKICRGGSWQ